MVLAIVHAGVQPLPSASFRGVAWMRHPRYRSDAMPRILPQPGRARTDGHPETFGFLAAPAKLEPEAGT
jgi:hypothetical protein